MGSVVLVNKGQVNKLWCTHSLLSYIIIVYYGIQYYTAIKCSGAYLYML